jgi:hypothetical protein
MKIAAKPRRQAAKQVAVILDGVEISLDKGIKDTVIALNALGYRTIGSCEGHLDHGTGGPWVNIMVDRAEDLETKLKRGRRRISKVEWLRISKQVKEVTDQELKELKAHLKSFYKNRKTRLDLKLALFNPGGGLVIVESRGVNTLLWKNLLEPRYSKKLLRDYQTEMDAFTKFLKKRLM